MKFLRDQKSLRDSFGPGLLGILKLQAETLSVPEKMFEFCHVLGRGNHQDVPDPRQHEGGERVVDHRFVVDGQQALANRVGHGIEPRPRSAGENNSLVLSGPTGLR